MYHREEYVCGLRAKPLRSVLLLELPAVVLEMDSPPVGHRDVERLVNLFARDNVAMRMILRMLGMFRVLDWVHPQGFFGIVPWLLLWSVLLRRRV